MRYVHTMVRVKDVEKSLHFYCNLLGLKETRRKEVPAGKFTLIFLAAPQDYDQATETAAPEIELTWNWESDETYETGRSWGHLAFRVQNIYETCQRLADGGVTINRPPRDGYMAFIRSPDDISIELIQEDGALEPQEPWASMENDGWW